VRRPATFSGGVRLPEYKELTAHKPIRALPLPPVLILPLAQNSGAVPRPVVERGTEVRRGQVIAEPVGYCSVPLHAPATGCVTAIGEFPHPIRGRSRAIAIETAGEENERRAPLPPLAREDEWTPETIRARVRDAGIVGMGGAGFPTHVKLTPPDSARIEYVILNGAECEPFLTVDHRILLETPEKALQGLRLSMKAAGAAQGIIALEENKKDVLDKIGPFLAPFPEIFPVLLRIKYPQGSEKQLIAALLGREVPSGKLPADVGCVVQNAQTCAAVADAVLLGEPLISRVVTVTGPGVVEPGNFRVSVGTPFSWLTVAAGGIRGDNLQILSGGPMMGIPQASLDAPVIKGTSGVVVLPAPPSPVEYPCVRCGSCVRVCPMGLAACDLARLSQQGKYDEFREAGGENCLECGCCAFVCPAKRELVQLIQLGKAAARGGRKET